MSVTQRFIKLTLVYRRAMLSIVMLFCLLHCSELFAQIINKKLVVSGNWTIKEPVLVEEEGELVISAGSRVYFDFDKEDVPGITVHGSISINGTEKNPVILQPKGVNKNISALKIESDLESEIFFARFKHFCCSLHIHFSNVRIEKTSFIANSAGIKLRAGNVVIQDNLFTRNVTAIRFWYANPIIIGNKFVNNETGIFIRGGVTAPIIAGNTMQNKRYDIKLSENQGHDIDARNNRWRSNKLVDVTRYIYDKRKSSYIGLIKILPVVGTDL